MNSFLHKSDRILKWTGKGLYCSMGGFYVDPLVPVSRAVITHAHSDHARPGSEAYLCASSCKPLLHERIGHTARVDGLEFSEKRKIGEVLVSFHPAGHILGSAQIRIECRGRVWVISGDYKTVSDPSCESWEPVQCDTFLTESTFALPVYRWPEQARVMEDLCRWWQSNREAGVTSVVFAYALGKAQRLIRGLREFTDRTVTLSREVAPYLPHYENQGCGFGDYRVLTAANAWEVRGQGLVVAPSSFRKSSLLDKLYPCRTAFASGWMLINRHKKRYDTDRGLVLSDHADWEGILGAIEATGASNVGVMHGFTGPLIRYLKDERGINSFNVKELL